MNFLYLFVTPLFSIWLAFLYSFAMYWLVIPAILPFILTTFIPKVKNILLKDKSIIYWIFGSILSYIVFVSISYIISLFIDFYRIESTIMLGLIGILIFDIYTAIYLLFFKFYLNNVQKRLLSKKDKYFLLGLNAIYSLLFSTLAFIIVEYDMARKIVRFFDEV